MEQVSYWGPTVLEWPVNVSVIWRFLLDACEPFTHFCMRGWRENCSPCALNDRRYASQFSRSGDFSTPVREHVSRGRIAYLLSPTRMMWLVMYFVIKIVLSLLRSHNSVLGTYILVLHFMKNTLELKYVWLYNFYVWHILCNTIMRDAFRIPKSAATVYKSEKF